jgi:hypothetical protein
MCCVGFDFFFPGQIALTVDSAEEMQMQHAQSLKRRLGDGFI